MLINILEQLISRLGNSNRVQRFLNGTRRDARQADNHSIENNNDLLEIGFGAPLDGGTTERIMITPSSLVHLLCLGQSGSGKTSLLLMLLQFFLFRETVVVIDRRDDLLDRVVRMIAAILGLTDLAQKLVLWDANDGNFATPFNPLCASSGIGDEYARASAMTSVMSTLFLNSGIVIQNVSQHLSLALAAAKMSLVEANLFLESEVARRHILSKVKDGECLRFWSAYDLMRPAQQRTFVKTFQTQLSRLLVRPEIRATFGQTISLDFRKLFDAKVPQVILIGLGEQRLGSEVADMLGQLVVAAISGAIVSRTDIPETERRSVRIVMDESRNFAALPGVRTLLCEGRRYRGLTWFSNQTLEQWNADARTEVLANTSCKAIFNCDASQTSLIAQNVYSDLGNEAIRRHLVRQPTGECLLLRRGEPSLHVKLHQYSDPPVTEQACEAVRAAGRVRFARPIGEVMGGIDQRHAHLLSEVGSSQGSRIDNVTTEVIDVHAPKL